MRVLRGLIVFVLAAIALAPVGSVRAETIIITDELHVRSVVLARHTVILDQADKITKIVSNSSESTVQLRMYRGTVSPENQVPLTLSLQEQYLRLLPAENRVGVLYDSNSIIVPLLSTSQTKLLFQPSPSRTLLASL